MLDYIWSIGDEALRDGRNKPPKPECRSGSATYVFLASRHRKDYPRWKDGKGKGNVGRRAAASED